MSPGGLRTALDLYEVGEKMVYQRLRRQLGDDAAARMALGAWREQRPGAEQGDGPGTPSARFDRTGG